MGLKEISFPFNPDSEEEVRVALTAYFQELGVSLSELSFEDSFSIRLGHNMIVVNKTPKQSVIHARSDMLLVRNGLPLAIVECKAPHLKLTVDDRDQGLSYARLLHSMPPYTIVTNGRELAVYDTLTTDLIVSGTPTSSRWYKHGMSYSNASTADVVWAAKTLLNTNLEILQHYCQAQVARNMRDLHHRYVPHLFMLRSAVLRQWEGFLQSTAHCFALVAPSGFGKTNALCHLVEQTQQSGSALALLYNAGQLWDGLGGAIRNDWSWEFDREQPLSRIVGRFAELAKHHGMRLVIFIDGLDEYPRADHLRAFAAELRDLAIRLDPTTVQLCVSCKTPDWPTFVMGRDQQLNDFSQSVFPHAPSADILPGAVLDLFSEDELGGAWTLYREHFELSGELVGETRQVCRVPLLLRLIAETYHQVAHAIPANLSNISIWDRYWAQTIGSPEYPVELRLNMQRIVGHMAEAMVELDRSELDEIDLLQRLPTLSDMQPAYSYIVRLGLLTRREIAAGRVFLSFAFDQLRAYIYTVHARRWLGIANSQLLTAEVHRVLKSRLGCDALQFFLAINTGDTSWLGPLLFTEPRLFVEATYALARLNDPYGAHARDTSTAQLSQRLRQFADTYAQLRLLCQGLKQRLPPYTEGDAGLWVCGGWHGWRTVSTALPQRIIALEPSLLEELLNQGKVAISSGTSGGLNLAVDAPIWDLPLVTDLPPTVPVAKVVQPVGDMSNILWAEVAHNLPQVVALQRLVKSLSKLAGSRLLDETATPVLLAERLQRLLAIQPGLAIQGVPEGKFWQLLGWKSFESAVAAPCTEMLTCAEQLLVEWIAQEQVNNGGMQRLFRQCIEKLFVLRWYLRQLLQAAAEQSVKVEHGVSVSDHIWTGDIYDTDVLISSWVPTVITNFREVLKGSFGPLADMFATYRHSGGRLLVELTFFGDRVMHGGYAALAYIWLPSAPAGHPITRVVPQEGSLVEQYLTALAREHIPPQILSQFEGNWATEVFAEDVALAVDVDGDLFHEPRAVLSRLPFPHTRSVAAHVYGLLFNEAHNVWGERQAWGEAERTNHLDVEAAVPFATKGMAAMP